MTDPSVVVRPYRTEDRAGVRRVYADTAFFGEPVENYLDDRELFADVGVGIYTDFEPQQIVVAEDAGTIVGYALGNLGGPAGVQAYTLRTVPWTLYRLVAGRYRVGRKTLAYIRMLVESALRRELLEVHSRDYRASLHIDIEAPYRGRGVGTTLIQTYLDHLRKQGVMGVHLVTTNLNTAAIRLYVRMGFRLLAQRRTRLWRRYVDGEVCFMAYGLRLAEPAQ